jgi:hypothetical protein
MNRGLKKERSAFSASPFSGTTLAISSLACLGVIHQHMTSIPSSAAQCEGFVRTLLTMGIRASVLTCELKKSVRGITSLHPHQQMILQKEDRFTRSYEKSRSKLI